MSNNICIFRGIPIDNNKFKNQFICKNEKTHHLGISKITVKPNFKEYIIEFIDEIDLNLANGLVKFISLKLYADGYYNYNINLSTNSLLPEIDSFVDSAGNKTSFIEAEQINMCFESNVALKITKDGKNVKQHPFKSMVNRHLENFDPSKLGLYNKLFCKFNSPYKIERLCSVYDFLLQDILGKVDTNGSIDISQINVKNYIKRKQRQDQLGFISVDNRTNRPNYNYTEDDLTFNRNLFGHNPYEASQACRIDNLLMQKLIYTTLLAIQDKVLN